MQDVDNIIEHLKKFSTNVLIMNKPVLPNMIFKFEKYLNLELPSDYKYLLSKTNGFSLFGDEILGLYMDELKYDLFKAYLIEHEQVMVPQPRTIIPFSPDGRGNFYCFDLEQPTNFGRSNAIVFWISNYRYTIEDLPEKTHNSLSEFIQECVIDWTLESFNYDGTSK